FGFQPEGFRHLKQHVMDLDPTVLFVCYGGNESFAGESGLPAFRKNLDVLLDVLDGTGARIVLVSPQKQEALGGKLPDPAAHNRDLALYGDVLRAAAVRRGYWYLDLFSLLPMKDTLESENPPLTYNSLHLTPEGYRAAADVVARKLGIAQPDWDAIEGLRSMVVAKNALFFHRWRPQNETYLTLFRKHEQGNNYREIPQFDPLIKEAEDRIAEETARTVRP
ncbi:unnamed protein product, partial [marine sediment metagenome]